jgi:hypothetical protein
MRATPQEVTGAPHLGRIDLGFGEPAAAQQSGKLVGVDLVIFGLAAMAGFHVERVPQDKGDFLFSAEIGEPLPGEPAFDRDDQTLTVGSNSREEWFRSGFHLTVQQGLTIMAQEADVHGTRMQVDAAVKRVWVGVASHAVSSFLGLVGFSHGQHTTGVCGGGGLNHYQARASDAQ